MNKSFSDGYALGQADGSDGENRLAMRSWVRSFTNLGSYLPGAENRDDQWINGYRNGFEDKVRHIYVQPFSKDDASMNNLTSSRGPDVPGTDSTGANNTFAHRIAVARNLYDQAVRLRNFLHHTQRSFSTLFAQHDLLAGEFFNDLLHYHIRPRLQEMALLADNVQTLDQPKIQRLVEKYEYAIRGKERGQVAATSFFASVNLAAADHLSGLQMGMGGHDPRDYTTQLAVARSVRRAFEGLLSQLDSTGRMYDACVKDHDELMRQDFDALIRQHLDPRLLEISNLWRAVHDKDLPGIDDVIDRLRVVSEM